jgi:hypothetical protein
MAIKTFTTGEVLTASDTNTYLANAGLVYITSTAVSGSTVTVSNCFNSTYDWYKVVLFVTGTVSGSDINIRMRTTSDDSSAVYSFSRIYAYSQTSSPTNQALELQTSGYVGTQENRGGNTQIDIYGPNAAQFTSIQSQNTGNKNAQPYAFQNLTGLTVSTTTQYTGFSLIAGQTMTGSLVVYGYRKA